MKKICSLLVVCVMLLQVAFAYSGVAGWAQSEISNAEGNGLIPTVLMEADMSKPVNRLEFAAISVKLYEALSGKIAETSTENPFTDTTDAEILKAYNLGITTGTSETTFTPDALLSREQAATMLARVYGVFSGTEIKATMAETFADDADISSWAKNAVYFMFENNVINGVGNNKFAPKNVTAEQEASFYANSTREQALVISSRMFKTFKSEEVDTESAEKIFESKIPVVGFGEEISRKFYETGLKIQYNDVTREEYNSYAADIIRAFPTKMNVLDTPSNAFMENTDGEYNISVVHGNDNTMTVTVNKI